MSIDDRVRHTLYAAADAQRVPDGLAARLQQSAPAGRPVVGVAPRHRWKRILPPLLAAAAVVIAAVTTTVVVSSQADRHAPAVPITSVPAPTPDVVTPTVTSPIPTQSTAEPAAPAQTALPLGAQGSIQDIPWTLVGGGWTLAQWAASNDATATTIFLIDPGGGRYLLGQVPAADFLEAWSPDLKRVLLWSRDYSSGTTIIERSTADWSVAHTFRLGLDVNGIAPQVVGYTFPKGLAILVEDTAPADPPAETQLHRYGEDGTPQLAYPVSYPSTGALNADRPLYTADGTQLVVGSKSGLAVIRNDGGFVRQLKAPGFGACTATRWVSPGVVRASCELLPTSTQHEPGLAEVWNLPLDGSKPTAVTTAAMVSPAQLGWAQAWTYTGGTLLLGVSGCGAYIPGRYDGHTFTKLTVTISGRIAPTLDLVGVHADTAMLLATACSPYLRTLVTYDLPSGQATPVLGASVNGGTVIEVAAYPREGVDG